MYTLKTAIIGGDPHFGELMETFLEEYCPNVQVVGIATNVETAHHIFKKTKPDFVIVDIEYAGNTYFDILTKLKMDGGMDFQIIFILDDSQNHHIDELFRYLSIRYITKPVDPVLLVQAINSVHETYLIQNAGINELALQLDVVYRMLQGKRASGEGQIFLQLPRKVWEKVDFQDIIYLKSDSNVTEFHLIDGRILKAMQHIGYYSFLTNNYDFFRVEQGCIVNLKHLVRYESQERLIRMSNGAHLYASRQKDRELRSVFVNYLVSNLSYWTLKGFFLFLTKFYGIRPNFIFGS